MTTTSRFHWWISLALLIFGGVLGLAFLAPREPLPVLARTERNENVLRIVYTQSLRPDPHVRLFPLSTYNLFVQSLWEPLVECDPHTGEPAPAAAASWSWSDNHRVLTLQLRPEARWSNGDPVTAHDFVRAWLRLLRSRIDLAYTLFPIKNAEAYHRGARDKSELVGLRAVDDLTLRIELDQPRTTLVAELADPMLAPLHASTEAVLENKTFQQNPAALVTNGPFRLTKGNADGYLLAASPTYHEHAAVRLAGVQFIRANNPSIGALLVAAGTADLLPSMNFASERIWPTRRAMSIESELVLGVVATYFNVTRGPLRDLRVRQALALAVNREDMIEESDRSRLVPAWSWVPDMPGRPGLSLFTEDAKEARRLLAEAGYPGGKGFPVLRMCLPLWMEGNPYPAACSERWFKELGIRVYVAYEGPSARNQRLNAGDYDIIYGALAATVPDPADLLTIFSMPAEYSETKWRDDETIRLLAAANHKVGNERLALVEQAERRAMAGAAAVPLMFERRHTLRSAEVRGWYTDPLARQSPKRLWLDLPLPPAFHGSPSGP
jgi:oligopeptide transport system substrate-binding protein